MSQPSLDEATHYRLDPKTMQDVYYKVGEETVYVWDESRHRWTFSLNGPKFVKSLLGITELRKPVISSTVEASDRLGRTGTMRDDIGDRHWETAALNETQDKSPVYQTWATMKPEELQPIEEHGCTEEEVEEVNEALVELPDGYTWRAIEEDVTPQHPNDKQVGGDHYKTMKIQPWFVVDDWLTKEQATGYYLASAIAYLARFNATGEGKGGLKDIQKAKHYLEKLESILLETE